MEFSKTKIPGAYTIKRLPKRDERGSFTRMFCKRELEAMGLDAGIAQINMSENKLKGTLRGLHYQKGEAAEDKIVTCIAGAVFDVCVDIRKDSPAFAQWVGIELTADNDLSLYVPKGCAHGYLTLCDNSSILYYTTQFYMPEAEDGCSYRDPAFAIDWPLPEPYIMTDKDRMRGFLE